MASITDDGETAAGLANQGVAGSADFPLISVGPLAGTLSTGAIADWTHRGTHYGKLWADAIATVYYGKAPKRHYYNGCSGGGNMGMGQLMNYGDEYDGMLIGAPAFYWSQFFLAYSWQPLVLKKLTQTYGPGALPTTGQLAALQASAISACDVGGLDNVADGIVEDPRHCTFSAQANVCGQPNAPGAPNCITSGQAAAIDQIWDGPRNHFGKRIWYPFDKTVLISPSTTPTQSLNLLHWDHKNNAFNPNNLYLDKESIALAGNPPNAITYEDEAVLSANTVVQFTDNENIDLSKAANHNTKVIHIHGTADPAIFWRDSVNFYNRVATWFAGGTSVNDYTKLQKWYRFFAMPGVGHCTEAFTPSAEGISASDPFLTLKSWVENNQAPNSLQGVTLSPAMTRPICPFPQQAIYGGTGSTTDASNYFCAGNEESWGVKCNDAITRVGMENKNVLAYDRVGLNPGQCNGAPTGGGVGD